MMWVVAMWNGDLGLLGVLALDFVGKFLAAVAPGQSRLASRQSYVLVARHGGIVVPLLVCLHFFCCTWCV